MENKFEIAIRNKYRFPYKGMISVEDLWDLKLTELDSIFKTLNAQVKQEQEESLLAVKSAADTELETKISIIRYIVATKQAEADKAKAAKETAIKKQHIMQLIADKQDAELAGKSIEELQALLSSM